MFADKVKRDARKVYLNVMEYGCRACPCREWCDKDFRQCRLNILRELQTRYDFRVNLQQVTGIY